MSTSRPTRAAWTAQQVVEAVGPHAEIMRLVRDRDSICGSGFDARVRNMGIQQVVIAPRSPWQNGYAERFVGTLRRELLEHVIVPGERHLLRYASLVVEILVLRQQLAVLKRARPRRPPSPLHGVRCEPRRGAALPSSPPNVRLRSRSRASWSRPRRDRQAVAQNIACPQLG
jgi:hypothetical protein